MSKVLDSSSQAIDDACEKCDVLFLVADEGVTESWLDAVGVDGSDMIEGGTRANENDSKIAFKGRDVVEVDEEFIAANFKA